MARDGLLTSAILLLGLGATGCGTGIYSSQSFGPDEPRGRTLQELIQFGLASEAGGCGTC
jgi:hypothetical protein